MKFMSRPVLGSGARFKSKATGAKGSGALAAYTRRKKSGKAKWTVTPLEFDSAAKARGCGADDCQQEHRLAVLR